MKKYCFPNYDESILSVTSSILKHYGYNSSYKSLKLLDEKLKNNYKNIILILLDGLGSENLKELSPNGILSQNKKQDISSVFPSTTVAATTTIESGDAPFTHGWLGWTLYFKEYNRRINIFPYVDADTFEKLSLDTCGARNLLDYETIYEKIGKVNKNVKCYTFHPEKITSTSKGANNCNYKDVNNMFNEVINICNNDTKNYIYFYHDNPDYEMHEFGSNNDTVKNTVLKIECQIEKLVNNIKDSLVIVLADHGHHNVKYINTIDIDGFNDCLERKISIETRACSLLVKENKEKEFIDIYNKFLKDDFLLVTKEQIIKDKLFGDGNKHFKFDDFIGNYMLIAISDKLLNDKPISEDSFVMKSTHAGITQREMLVPLVLFEK